MRGLLLLWMALPWLHALDESIIADPRSVTFRDRRAEQHWQALFEPFPTHPLRHLIALNQRDPDRYPSLLAARLLYRGNPWTRRGDESGVTQTEWRRRCQPLLVATLRELRFRDEAELQHVDIAVLALDGDTDITIAALIDLLRRDRTIAKAGALRVAISDHAEALPAARNEEARKLARGLLVEHFGIADAQVQQALMSGINRGSRRERNAALALIERGAADQIILPCLSSLMAACAKAEPAIADLDGLALACDRLGSLHDQTIANDLATLAIQGRREVARAACAVLARALDDQITLPIDRIAAAIAADSDVHRRHARANLLLRRAPQALIDKPVAGQAWQALAEHRAALARWATPNP